MLIDAFRTVLILSAAGGAVALLLLLLKPITRKIFGCGWQYYIWLCPIIIMLLPIAITPHIRSAVITPPEPAATDGEYSVYVFQTTAPIAEETIAPAGDAAMPETAAIPPAMDNTPDVRIEPMQLLAAAWLTGAILFFGGYIVSYARFWHRVRSCAIPSDRGIDTVKAKIPKRIQILYTRGIDTPMLAGLLRPVLLLPETAASSEDLDNIIRHELMHYRRHDMWYKWLALIANSVHWFNPLSYVISHQVHTECEISCDLAATRKLDSEEKRAYMRTILSTVQNKNQKNNNQP